MRHITLEDIYQAPMLDFDGSILDVPVEDFIGPPTLAEWRADLFHAAWDHHNTYSDAEIDALLEKFPLVVAV